MCNCIEMTNKSLEEYNTKLDVTISLFPEAAVLGILVSTTKLDARKRGVAKNIVATYCPFCGEKYNQMVRKGEMNKYSNGCAALEEMNDE